MNKKRKFFNRYTALLVIVLLLLGLLGNRLYNLQIVNGEEAKAKADNRTIKYISEPAPRGEILDKNGEVLATNEASYTLLYNETTESSKNFYKSMSKLFKLLEQTGEKQVDEFPLKVNPYRFEFNIQNEKHIKSREQVFKNERGLSEYVLKNKLTNLSKKTVKDLTKEERSLLNTELAKINPEETFKFLIKELQLYKILGLSDDENAKLAKAPYSEVAAKVLAKYKPEEIRKYMLIRDQIRMNIYQASKAIKLSTNLKKESAFTFMQQANILEGITVLMEPTRIYPYGNFAAHILGFLAPINEGNKSKYESMGYDINNDYIGAYGIEGAFESLLRGNKTVKTVKVDKQGRAISNLFQLEGYPGSSIELSIDKNIQNVTEKALQQTMTELQTTNRMHMGYDAGNATRGAAVVMDVNTGKILALASNPGFDPNLFAVPGRITPDIYKKFFNPDYEEFGKYIISNMKLNTTVDALFPKDENGERYDKYDLYPKPFLNYATQGLSPVGSIFKPFTSIAGLEEGVITKDTRVNDTGKYVRKELPGYEAQNANGKAFGNIGVVEAILYSSNVFFLETGYQLKQLKGLNALANWSWKLGLGNDPKEGYHSNTGIEINENIYGNVYNFETKKRLMSNASYSDLVRVLKKGVDRNGKALEPFDVSFKDSDSKEVKEAKEQIKDSLKKFWLGIEIDDKKTVKDRMNEVEAAIDYNLNTIKEALPENVKNKLASSTKYAQEFAMFTVFDRYQELKTPVNVMNASIGQGDAQLTILQIVNGISTLVNGGTRYRTSLVNKIIDPEGNVTKVIEPETLQKINLKKENIDTIKEGMYLLNHDPRGSGYASFKDFPIKTGGKTGTAEYQTGDNKNIGRGTYGTYVAFAPLDKPQIAIATIIYDSLHGYLAIPMARAIMEEYFYDTLKKDYPDYKRKFNWELKPVMKVSDSLLKLKKPNPTLVVPLENQTNETITKPTQTKEDGTTIPSDKTETKPIVTMPPSTMFPGGGQVKTKID